MSGEDELYQKRIPIFPRSVKGRYRTLKYIILFIAYAVYFLLPWIPWDRAYGPSQSVLFDIVGRRFYIFNLTVFAQDIFWLAGFMIVAAFLLFFVTGLAGRVFCGYFCFQTLWTDVYQLIERMVQGERNARIKLASASWGLNKLSRMSLTWLLWLLVAFWTGLSFTLYWGHAPELFLQFFRGQAPFPAYATTLFLTATTFVMAGLAREQVCTYMCPYARFQSAMFDPNTLIVAYDEKRGERDNGRAKPGKSLLQRTDREQQGVGDCIDCGYCVQVCPVGIDIRNGIQYQCITCALCIDACNTVMRTIKYPTGLIRYTSENELQGEVSRRLTFKNVGYGLAILVVTGFLVWTISHHSLIEMSVRQTRQPLYVMLSDGSIQNRYTIKINNKHAKSMTYILRVKGLADAQWEIRPNSRVTLEAGESASYEARVWLKPSLQNRHEHEFTFILQSPGQNKVLLSKHVDFYMPNDMR